MCDCRIGHELICSVPRAEKVEILQRTKRGLHGVQCAVCSLRFIMTAFPCFLLDSLERQEMSHKTWSYFLFAQHLEAYLLLGL